MGTQGGKGPKGAEGRGLGALPAPTPNSHLLSPSDITTPDPFQSYTLTLTLSPKGFRGKWRPCPDDSNPLSPTIVLTGHPGRGRAQSQRGLPAGGWL